MTTPQPPYGQPQQPGPGYPPQAPPPGPPPQAPPGYQQQPPAGYPQQPPPGQPGYLQQPYGAPQQYGQPPQFGAPPPGKPSPGLVLATAIVDIAVAIYALVMGVLLGLKSLDGWTDPEFLSVPGELLSTLAALILLAAGGVLGFGAVQLFQKKRAGVRFTWLGGALALLSFPVDWAGSIVGTLTLAPQIMSFEHVIDIIRPISIVTVLAGAAALVLGLLPQLKRSVQ
ncbi:hypothetical protein HUO13_34070 [Saccharopolyspora erythraea]|uniref:hypothetical protein n=1 Tax=Saccharopolyspora erythraea TaxID=1836 RepID=UPI001BA461D3|nr:hypothetical protein [Saccharopolyspora erythraea]QUH05136.1 hypothetical protein HUO13_34070 [Saccharopolyspora erythraea]